MIIYSQRDPRWADKKLMPTSQTFAKIGCTVTSIAMLTTYFKPDRTPLDLLRTLQFTADGRILWGSCNFENFKFDFRGYARNDDAIQFYLKDEHRAVILEVANGTHWVVALKKPLLGNNYKIADPFFGDISTMERYKGNITGAAYFVRKP